VVLSPGARALEIGCGLGRLLRPLASRVENAWGVDVSDEMVARAKEALFDVANAEVLPTDGTLAHFGDATIDLVISFIVFQHIPAKRIVSAYICEAARALKGDGVFRFQVDGRPRRKSSRTDTWFGVRYTAEELCRELANTAFEVIDVWGEGTQYLWITALRKSEPGRSRSTAVSVRRRAWSRERLEALLVCLGANAADQADAVLRGEKSLRALALPFLKRQKAKPADEFVRRAYAAILGREPDVEGLTFYSQEIARGVSPDNTVDCLLASAELEDRLRPHVPSVRN
jgi:SAM-dependent methyltransferase